MRYRHILALWTAVLRFAGSGGFICHRLCEGVKWRGLVDACR
jgi:hypothetical protein